eukprot:6491642-Amphidinium_carterae.6
MAALKRVNITKITKTQILTIVLVLLLLTYSVPLIWCDANQLQNLPRPQCSDLGSLAFAPH